MANKNFSSKRLIQDTGRKMGLATTVKRAQKRDPSEETFFDKKRGKELAAVSKEDMKDAGFTSFGKDSLGEYLNMKKKLGRKPKKSDFSDNKNFSSKKLITKKNIQSGIQKTKKKNKNFSSKSLITKKNIESSIPKTKKKNKNFSSKSLITKKNIESGIPKTKKKDENFSSKNLITKKSMLSGVPKKKQSVITSSYNRKPNTGAMSYRKKGGDLFVAKQYGGKII